MYSYAIFVNILDIWTPMEQLKHHLTADTLCILFTCGASDRSGLHIVQHFLIIDTSSFMIPHHYPFRPGFSGKGGIQLLFSAKCT